MIKWGGSRPPGNRGPHSVTCLSFQEYHRVLVLLSPLPDPTGSLFSFLFFISHVFSLSPMGLSSSLHLCNDYWPVVTLSGVAAKFNFRTVGGTSLLPHFWFSLALMDVLEWGLHFYGLPFPPRRPPLREGRRILGGHCTRLQEVPIGEVCVGLPGPSGAHIPEMTVGPPGSPVKETSLNCKKFIFTHLEYISACFFV